MSKENEARAYQLGNLDGIDAANVDAPTPECDAGDVMGRAWTAAEDQEALHSQSEREEYFIGWTHGYVVRAEGIESGSEAGEGERTARATHLGGSVAGTAKTDLLRPEPPSDPRDTQGMVET